MLPAQPGANLDHMVGVPVVIKQALRLKAMGTVFVRFSNTPITSHGREGARGSGTPDGRRLR
jgi:hypothetical protein